MQGANRFAPRAQSQMVAALAKERQQSLAEAQAARLLGRPPDVADAVLDELRRTAILARSPDGVYFPDR
jgi:hypothetical protein